MHARHGSLLCALAILVLAAPGRLLGQAPSSTPVYNPYPYAPDEPAAKRFSHFKAARYLNGVSQFWMRENSCGACHANYAFLMLRPLLTDHSARYMTETRRFLEQRKSGTRFSFHGESVGIAFSLSWDDARNGNKLQQSTRQALARMWSLQRPQGDWPRLGCGDLIPAENDRHHTAALAALAAGVAPEGYARSADAQDGLTRLRRYFVKSPPTSLHNDVMLLWASMHLDGLLTAKERDDTIQALFQRQRTDGGWSTAALSSKAFVAEYQKYPSDGYGTGFSLFALRQAGVPANRPEIARGVAWLKSHQRVSGRWFTPAPVGDTEGGVGSRDLYAQNHATAFSLLALHSCNAMDRPFRPAVAAIVDLADHVDDADVPQRAEQIVNEYDSCDISQVFTLRGAGIGNAVAAGRKNSIDMLVRDWSGPKPPTKAELRAHHDDLLQVSRVLQAMAELAPHRMALLFPDKDDRRAQELRQVTVDFKTNTRRLRESIARKNPAQVRDAAIRLQQTCAACHKVVGI